MGAGVDATLFDTGHRRLTTGMVLVVSFIAFEAIAVATALPAVSRHLDGVRLYGWAFSAFMLAQLVGIVVAGPVVDRVGMTGPLVVGSVLFSLGLLLGGAAPTMVVLVLGRAVQGAGAGVVTVTLNVAVGRSYPPALRPRAYAAMSTAWVVPSVAGPVVAGAVAEHLTWRLVFLGLIPAVAAGVATAAPALRDADRVSASHSGASARRDTPTSSAAVAVTLALGTALVLNALSLRQPVVAPLLGLSGLALAIPSLRAVLPARLPAPGARHLPTMAVAALAHFSFFGAEAFLPLALTVLHRRSLTEAGATLTVAAFTWTAGTWVQAHTQDTLGPRVLAAAGLGLVALGVTGVAALDWAGTPWWLAFVAWGVSGAGMGLTYATTSLVVVSAAGPGRQGGPVAAMQVLVTLGVAVGTGIGGAALAWSVALGHGRAPGLRIFDLGLVVAALVGLGLTVAMPRRVPEASPLVAASGTAELDVPPGASPTPRA